MSRYKWVEQHECETFQDIFSRLFIEISSKFGAKFLNIGTKWLYYHSNIESK